MNGKSRHMSSTDHTCPYQGHMMKTCELRTGNRMRNSTKAMISRASNACMGRKCLIT